MLDDIWKTFINLEFELSNLETELHIRTLASDTFKITSFISQANTELSTSLYVGTYARVQSVSEP